MNELDGFTIAIVGLGLMGGSLAMALKQNRIGRCVQGADANPQIVAQALSQGVIDAPCTDIGAVDLIVLAMPVRGILEWLKTRGTTLTSEQIVMDLGSTKQEICALMESLPAQCIGGHPMCGKETSGLVAAEASLFRGARFVLTPTSRTTMTTLNALHRLIARIGAQALVMDAAIHDRAVAAISHMPYLLSANLVNTVAELDAPFTPQLAAGGYASMTRLAASDIQMMGDIIATNRANVLQMLDAYQAELTRLRNAIAADAETQWRAQLEQARRTKKQVA